MPSWDTKVNIKRRREMQKNRARGGGGGGWWFLLTNQEAWINLKAYTENCQTSPLNLNQVYRN